MRMAIIKKTKHKCCDDGEKKGNVCVLLEGM